MDEIKYNHQVIPFLCTNDKETFIKMALSDDMIWVREGKYNGIEEHIPTIETHPHLERNFMALYNKILTSKGIEIDKRIKTLLKDYKYIIVQLPDVYKR